MAKRKKKEPLKNITQHELVPDHTILSEKEKKEVLEKYDIEANQLPKILTTDPVSISIGAKAEDVIKIIRKSPTAKEAVAYRLVVESSK